MMHTCHGSPPDERYPAHPQAVIAAPQLSPPTYVLSMTSYGIEHPFGQFGPAVLAVSPPRGPGQREKLKNP